MATSQVQNQANSQRFTLLLAGGNDPSTESSETKTTSHLHQINPTDAPAAKLKSNFQWLRECISLGFTWTKIAIHHLLPFNLVTLKNNTYENPFTKPKALTQDTYKALATTLEHGLDYLKAVDNDNPNRCINAISQSQKLLIHELCHGEASDFLLNLMNYCIQEGQNSNIQAQLLQQLPDYQKRQILTLINTLQASNLFARAKDFSQYLTRKQQIQMLEKLNEFPARQMKIIPKIANKALRELDKHDVINTLMKDAIQGQKSTENNHEAKIPTLTPEEMVPKLKTLAEVSAGVLDAYERASRESNPNKAAELRDHAILELTNNTGINQTFVQAYHYLLDTITEASTSTALNQSRLFALAKAFSPQIPDTIIQQFITELCKYAAGPVSLIQKFSDRLSLQQEVSILFTLLHRQPEMAQNLMHLCLNGVKTLTCGEAPEKAFNELPVLNSEFNIKEGCKLAHELLTGGFTPKEIHQTIQNHPQFIRHLLSQKNPRESLAKFCDLLPIDFQENTNKLLTDYHFESILTIGKYILPHISDKELTQMLNKLPTSTFEAASDNLNRGIQHLGDPDNNLITTLDDRQKLHKIKLTSHQEQVQIMFPALFSNHENNFITLLQNLKIRADQKGKIPEQRLTPIKYEWNKLNTIKIRLNELESMAPMARPLTFEHLRQDLQLQYFDQLNSLLAEMGIKKPEIATTGATLTADAEQRNILAQLKMSLTDHRISHELHKTTKQLFPKDTPSTENNNQPGIIQIELRKKILSEFFNAITVGMQIENNLHTPATTKQDVDHLWALTKDLISETDRTIVIEHSAQNPIIDSKGRQSQLIFMEDGSCVNKEGAILPKGNIENSQLREEHNIKAQFEELQIGCRPKMKALIQKHWPMLVKLMADYPTNTQFTQLLQNAQLPHDVQTLMVNLLDQLLPQDLRESQIGQYATRGMSSMSHEVMNQIIDTIPDGLLDRFSRQVTRLINDLDPYKQMPFFTEFADQLVASLGENQSVQKVADKLTKGYYTAVCHADKRALANAILELGCPEFENNGQISSKSMTALVGAMTQAGGPAFQKAMQLFKSDINIPSIRDALANMDSGVNPMPSEHLKHVVEHELDNITDDNNHKKYELVNAAEYDLLARQPATQGLAPWPSPEDINNKQLKLLGSATIAQSHIAYLWHCVDGAPDKTRAPEMVAVKVQRDNIVHRISREMAALDGIPDTADSVKQTLDELKRSIVGETDFSREYQFGNLMQELYTESDSSGKVSDDVKVVDMLAHGNRLLIQRFSPGATINALWQEKSAEFSLYFGNTNAYVEKTLTKNPNRIQVNTSPSHTGDRYISSITIKTKDTSTTHMIRSNDPLFLQLTQAQNNGQIPGYADTTALTEAIFNRFENPLMNTINTAQWRATDRLKQQATFLDIAGDRLAGLVGRFAKAAFAGVEPKNAYHYSTANPAHLETDARARKVFIDVLHESNQHSIKIQHYDTRGELGKTTQIPFTPTEGEENTSETQLAALLKRAIKLDGNSTFDRFAASAQLKALSDKETAELNNTIREVLGESMLFEGESFIDSDRHDGNLLFRAIGENLENSELMCIDTGAGTVITQHERYGMLQLAQGIAFTDATLITSGLNKLIPDFTTILERDDTAFRANNQGKTKRQILERDLFRSIRGENIEEEKCQEIFQFLLTKNMINSTITKDFFNDLLKNKHPDLNKDLFNFGNIDRSINAILEYVNRKHSANELEVRAIDGETKDEFKTYLKNLDYGRVYRSTGPVSINPFNYEPTTDKHNSLLFIKSIRKIANVLDSLNIYAPESIIQLNRGTKFIEDQIKLLNTRKQEVKRKIEALTAAEPNLQGIMIDQSTSQKLAPINLGVAYMSAIPMWQMTKDMYNSLSMTEKVRAFASFAQGWVMTARGSKTS